VAVFTESRTEALLLSKADFERYSPTCFRLYPLSDRMVALIASCLRYAEWDARWLGRDADTQLVTDLERVLMSLCMDELVKSNILLLAAITGQQIDLSTLDLEDYLNNYHDFRSTGLANRLGPEVQQDNELTVVGQLAAIKEVLAGIEEEDYTDELLAIAAVLGA